MAMPLWLYPMAATLTAERFTAPGWSFERKFDGIRMLAFKSGSSVTLLSRNRLTLTASYPDVARAIAALPAMSMILDGEATGAWGRQGRADYHVFDVLWLNGKDITRETLEARRRLLGHIPFELPIARVRPMSGAAPWDEACRKGWEGVIAKRLDSIYEHRRSKAWLKMKCEASQELVVGGFTDPQGSRVGLGALLVGHYDGGDLVFAGKVGTSLERKAMLDLRARLDGLLVEASPFAKGTGLPRTRVHWVRPALVVQVAFTEWTVHGKLRHPRLLGIRTDKVAREVVRERP
jgi:bifunctional non-homologous end joining protein LigD